MQFGEWYKYEKSSFNEDNTVKYRGGVGYRRVDTPLEKPLFICPILNMTLDSGRGGFNRSGGTPLLMQLVHYNCRHTHLTELPIQCLTMPRRVRVHNSLRRTFSGRQ